MKKAFLALLLLVGAAATVASVALAQDEGVMKPSYQLLRQSLAAKSQDLRTSIASDSQFVGHSFTDHTGGGANPWNIWVGTSRPGINPANSAIWEFDNQTGLSTPDSLQGWWPMRLPYRYAPIATMTDDTRPWYAVDHGNQVNYRPINGRTYGVTGVWHADPGKGADGTLASLVRWTPLADNKSMWCGLRALNDHTVLDPITGQPYNERAMAFNIFAGNTAAAPIFACYPGYGNAWDQILYRDFDAVNGASMNIKFLYKTAMSTSFPTGVTTRTGWFHGDPLSMTAGNFLSSNAAGANAPRDSFSVYIGVPVNDLACAYTDGNTAPVFDKQRRWFDEVLKFDAPYFEILGQAGSAPADTTLGAVSIDQTIPWADPANGNAYISAIYNAADNAAHKVRLAFRVKTNRSYSDDDYKSGSLVNGLGYTSDGRGAAVIDNVVVDGTTYDFEGVNGGVDNAEGTSPSSAWKSTGKPAPSYFHPVDVTQVTWNDLCGQPHSSTSICNLEGIVASIGNADQSGAIADGRWASQTEWIGGMVSPTVNLVTNPDNVTPNNMGITGAITPATDDYYIQYELNFAAFVLANTGTLWNFGCQVYPALTANGHYTWSDLTGSPFRFYQSFPGCQSDLEPLKANSMIHTSNANGIPDSLRIYLGITAECFYFGGTCNSTDGGYFDDISVILANKASADPVGSIASDIWQFFNDAFPVNGYATDNVPAGSSAFDTTTALVKGAINIASSTGDVNRFDVLQDSVTVSAPNGTGGDPRMRVDLVFRILPGPGNYKVQPGRTFPPTSAMELLKAPTSQATVITAGDGSFWSAYIADDGLYGTGAVSGVTGGTHPATAGTFASRWDYLRWNSARCDTVGTLIFPVTGKATEGVDNNGNTYQTTYHDADSKFGTLGIVKGICYMINPTGTANSTNISCDAAWNATPGNLSYGPGGIKPWPLDETAPAAISGAPGSDIGVAVAVTPATPIGTWETKEYTKIIPDGLLTPGSHVQYFFRKQRIDNTGSFVMDPDTTNISPQLSESNFDGHRWQQFGVLPDRWKGAEFGGPGMACMLYIDNNDRRGDERVWVSVMDSIGGTLPAKWGAHNGWHATGAGFGLYNQTNPGIAAAFVNKNQQPGTVWDMYGVKASESAQTGGTHIGNRYAVQPNGFMTGKGASIGPKKDWLRAYYRMVTWLTGDGNTSNIGPVPNVGEDDIGLIEDFLSNSTGTAQPRQLLVQGDGFAEQCDANGGVHLDFLNNYLFCGLRAASYTDLTPSLVSCPDLIADPLLVYSPADIYGVVNTCTSLNDVLEPGSVEASVASSYEAVGANAPYRSGVEHAATGAHNWHSILNGWDMFSTYSRNCATSNGRVSYYSALMFHAFGSICGTWSQTATLDVPNNQHGGQFVNFMKVGNSVMRSSNATIRFGVENAGRVRVRLYDVTGRVIKTVADRNFEAGNDFSLQWNGTDDAGNQVARGVYFARIEFAKGAAINGRVVVLR